MLREWLEVQGYGVIETGWTRSELMQPTIELAKRATRSTSSPSCCFHATDFADGLKGDHSGAQGRFDVLSDRYIYTAMARAGVRGVDKTWCATCTASASCRIWCST